MCLAITAVCLVSAVGILLTEVPIRSAAGLVGHWAFDEGVGAYTSDSAVTGAGTLVNGASWVPGPSGYAVAMDGYDDYIALPNFDVTGYGITLAAWVWHESFPWGVEQRIISKADDPTERRSFWTLAQTNVGENRLQFRLKAGGSTTTLTAWAGDLPLNSWYHAAATYDGATMRLYVNGEEVGYTAKTGSIPGGSVIPVHLGRSPEGSNYLHGGLEDVRVYSVALSPAEIAELLEARGGPTASEQSSVWLTAPAPGQQFTAPANITLSAGAGSNVSRVEFYEGSQHIGTSWSAPFDFSWSSVGAGSYALTAVARDIYGGTTVSSTRDITVFAQNAPYSAVFAPSPDHDAAVQYYVLDVFYPWANPAFGSPVASLNLGKPAVTNGECWVNIASTIHALPAGTYIATITAVGTGGIAQSAPSPQFNR